MYFSVLERKLSWTQMYPSNDQKSLSWSGSQGGEKVAMKMLTSTTWNEDFFALSFSQSHGAEASWPKPLWCSTDRFVWLLPKYSSGLEMWHCLEFYTICWKTNSIGIVMVELCTDTSGCFSLKMAILALSYIGRIQVPELRSTPIRNWIWNVDMQVIYDSTKT